VFGVVRARAGEKFETDVVRARDAKREESNAEKS
jgi:hypothetical protein